MQIVTHTDHTGQRADEPHSGVGQIASTDRTIHCGHTGLDPDADAARRDARRAERVGDVDTKLLIVA